MRETFLKLWLALGKRNRRVLAADFFVLALAVYLGYALRLSVLIAPSFRGGLLKTVFLYPGLVIGAFLLCGVYRIYWPQAGAEEYVRLSKAYVLGVVLFVLVNYLTESLAVPRSALAVATFAGLLFIVAERASWRLAELFDPAKRSSQAGNEKNTVIIGAGEAGAYIARDIVRRSSGLCPIGFIDEDPMKRGKIISGLPVLGDRNDLERIVRDREIKAALIAIPSASGKRVRGYLEILSRSGVEVRVLPSLYELAGGRIEISRLRSVELQDLLRREPISLDEEVGVSITGKRILVTGAGGSIGSEICEQVFRHHPSEMFLLGHGEQSIYNLLQRLGELGVDIPIRPIIADIADEPAMQRLFSRYRPQVVFHAAAHKHVPLMEENCLEALRVNAVGTWILAELSGLYEAERFVMISSDKAVHPSSVMGATKRIAERLLRSAQGIYPSTRYMTVRFGNVLGSRGSVVPLFERQIRKGGPVTVTHRDMRRYFMLIPEAVSLVLQAGAMGRGGELYVLDMGEPVNITEMAETLIRLHGHEPYTDVKIVFTGIRPGEKLYEELFYDPDHVDRTSHEKIFLSRLQEESKLLIDGVKEILTSVTDDREAKRRIFSLASE